MLHLCQRLCVTIGTIDERRLMPLRICIHLIICIQRGCFQPWGSSIVQPLPHRALSETKYESDLDYSNEEIYSLTLKEELTRVICPVLAAR